jgi:hypothetical protein
MGTATTANGTKILWKDWGAASRSSSVTGGRCRPATGTPSSATPTE